MAINGVRTSGTFATKGAAVTWAIAKENELRNRVTQPPGDGKTLEDALDRYEREGSVHKRGHHWEKFRLRALSRHVLDGKTLGERCLNEITPDLIGRWRDHRMQGTPDHGYADRVSGSTVNRELNILSHVFTTARREWKWIDKTPITDVRRPKEAPHRDRLVSEYEIERLCIALGFDNTHVLTVKATVAAAFLFAIETAMRAGEILSLTRKNINGALAHLPAQRTARSATSLCRHVRSKSSA